MFDLPCLMEETLANAGSEASQLRHINAFGLRMGAQFPENPRHV
jgi:hypothetical protein